MSLWLAAQPLVLASKSESRRALLEAAGIPVEVRPAEIDERAIEARAGAIKPGDAALLLACEKARVVAGDHPHRIVLGADQTLALGDQRFAKATDRLGVRSQLAALRGKAHILHSALAVMRNDTVLFKHVDTACLTMRAFSDAFLDRYLDVVGNAATASVGGYQLEGIGVQLFDRVAGDHSTILGLPLLPLLHWMREQDVLMK